MRVKENAKPRPLRDLLILVRDELSNPNTVIPLTDGLCNYGPTLRDNGIINRNESNLLFDFYQDNMPLTSRVLVNKITRQNPHSDVWWSEGNRKPRIKWLTKKINNM